MKALSIALVVMVVLGVLAMWAIMSPMRACQCDICRYRRGKRQ